MSTGSDRNARSLIPAVELRELAAFAAVVETGSFRAAARALGYTQSAISHQIEALERRLAARVFLRPGGRGRVILTAVGELAYQHARRVLSAAHALHADVAAALAGERGGLRIGTSQSTSFLLVEPLVTLRRHSPGIEISLVNTSSSSSLTQQLSQGQLDLGFYINFDPDDRVATIPLFDDSWTVLAARNDERIYGSSLSVDALDGVDMIAWHARWRAQASLEQVWRLRNIRPRIVYRSDDNLMIQRLVAAGLGWACLGRLSVRHLIDPALTRIALTGELPARTLVICHARHRQLNAAALALIDAVQAVFRTRTTDPTDI